uniref:Uncharacterized protein n=1 Tax=Oryza rufipogon TaxID=4529 RepID=A0A0E0QPG3_ORYRU
MKMRMGAQDMKLKGLKRALKEQKARLYIIRRCGCDASLVSSSRCCCFLILDLRADSRFDSFLLFLFFSIWAWRFRSSSDLELRVPWLDPDEVPLDMFICGCLDNYVV